MAEHGAETAHEGTRLGTFIQERMGLILREWEFRARSFPAAERLGGAALRDHVPELLVGIAQLLQGSQADSLQTLSALPDKHALERLDAGYDLRTATEELSALRDTILELWEHEVATPLPVRAVRQLNRVIDEVIAISAARFAQARERTLKALDRVSSAALGTGDLDTFLPQLMTVLLETVAAVDSVAILLRDEHDNLGFRAAIGLTEACQYYSARVGEGFLGRVAAQREPLSLRDAAEDPQVLSPTIRRQGIHALYAVPLIHEGRVIGVTHMGSRTAYDFSDDDKQLLRAMGQRATSLIVQAQLLERLRESESRLQSIVDHAPAAIFVKDAEGRFLLVNRYLESVLRRPREGVLGRRAQDLWPQALARRLSEIDRRVLEQATPMTVEESVSLEKEVHTFLIVKFPIPGGSGQQDALGGIATDITEHQRVEAALRETSEVMRSVLDTALDGIITIDERGVMQAVNATATRLFGYSAEELLGHSIGVLMPEPYRREHDRYLRDYRLTGERRVIGRVRELWGQRKDGSVFPLELSVSETQLPRGRLYTGLVRDISQRKESERSQELLIEAGTALAQSLDVETTLKSLASLAVAHLADYCMVDLLGEDGQLHRQEVLAREPERRELIRRVMGYAPRLGSSSPVARVFETGKVATADITPEWLDAAARDSEHRALLEALAPRSAVLLPLKARGRTLGVMNLASREPGRMAQPSVKGVAQGLADRAAIAIDNARLYQEAREAVRVREDVVAIVSHDLRNPLNAISLSASTLIKREELDERTAKAAARIYSAADRAHRLIRDLLDFTQARVGGIPVSPRRMDLGELARQVVEELQSAYPERSFELRSQEGVLVQGDPDRLAQVMANLVGNAVQHGPADSPVHVAVRQAGEVVLFEVHNQGAPISAEQLPTLFEPFHRGRKAGAGTRGSLGLGLFISKQIMAAHGGRIEVRSEPGLGTIFTVRLPRLTGETERK